MDVFTFANIPIPTMWGTSEERPRNLLDVLPALFERTSNVFQRVRSHAAHTLVGEKSFVHAQNVFRSLACENESRRVRTFAKHVQRWQNVTESCADRVGRVTTCDKILPHVGHTLKPHV